MASQAAAAAKALELKEYSKAVELYSKALEEFPNSPNYYIGRSTANQRAGEYQYALHDAEMAVVLATQRGRRELIATAQFRRAIALANMERLGDARHVLGVVKKLNDKQAGFAMWEQRVNMQAAKLQEGDEKLKVTVTDLPETCTGDEKSHTERIEELDSSDDEDAGVKLGPNDIADTKSTEDTPPSSQSQSGSQAPTPFRLGLPVGEGSNTPPKDIKEQWYQTGEYISISISARNAPKDTTIMTLNENSLRISFPLTSGDLYIHTIDPFYAPVETEGVEPVVIPAKIEIRMDKKYKGVKWPTLRGTKSTPSSSNSSPQKGKTTAQPPKPTAPSYPTSAKSGPKDWDAVVKKEIQAETGKEDVDMEFDEDGGDPAGGFFKKLYKNADPDTQRAMMKSYIESNGTALSTNWDEVSKGKVETSPPDGMEARQWGRE